MLHRAAGQAAVQIEAVGTSGSVVVEHGDDVGPAVLLEANMGNVALGEEFLRAFRNGALGMLANGGGPGVGHS